MFLKSKNGYALLTLASLMAVSACNGSGSSSSSNTSTGIPQGQDELSGPPAVIPTSDVTPAPGPTQTTTPEPTPTASSSPVVGTSCHSSDSSQICLGLRYVVYTDSKDVPVVTEAEAIQNVTGINSVWKACKIAFQIDEFLPEDPTSSGLTFNTANYSELDSIRSTYQSSSEILVVTTGKWDRSGTLGNTGANAWTNMPGESLYGAILESAVGTYSNIIAHELGHYLNLDHVSDSSNLMNPIIYDTSTNLTSSQCSAAQAAANYYWKKMLR